MRYTIPIIFWVQFTSINNMYTIAQPISGALRNTEILQDPLHNSFLFPFPSSSGKHHSVPTYLISNSESACGLCDWILSHIMSSRFITIVVCYRLSFLLRADNICVSREHLFQSLHLSKFTGCFHSWANESTSVMSTSAGISSWGVTFKSPDRLSAIAGPNDKCIIFSFWEIWWGVVYR